MTDEPDVYGAGFIIYTDDGVLLHKRDGCAPRWPFYWCALAGRNEPEDRGDPLATALRELAEEVVGIDIGAIQPERVACIEVSIDAGPRMLHFFRAPLDTPFSELQIGNEGDGLAIFTERELDALMVVPTDRLALDVHFGRFPPSAFAPCPVHG